MEVFLVIKVEIQAKQPRKGARDSFKGLTDLTNGYYITDQRNSYYITGQTTGYYTTSDKQLLRNRSDKQLLHNRSDKWLLHNISDKRLLHNRSDKWLLHVSIGVLHRSVNTSLYFKAVSSVHIHKMFALAIEVRLAAVTGCLFAWVIGSFCNPCSPVQQRFVLNCFRWPFS